MAQKARRRMRHGILPFNGLRTVLTVTAHAIAASLRLVSYQLDSSMLGLHLMTSYVYASRLAYLISTRDI